MRENLRPAPGINTPHSLHPTTEAPRPPLLSVVIACNERPDSLATCIEAVRESCREIATELIVVSSLAGPSVNDSISRYAGVRAIMLNEEALVPHLWAEGIARANGSIIALTISQCVPVREWAGAMVGSISKGAAAAGGPLSLHSDASNVDAAIFFLRYSAVLPGSNAFFRFLDCW
jgi:hypothetical protein